MAPMRSSIPSKRVACASSIGRNSPIRGTMTQCSVPQASRNISHAPSNNHKEPRAKADRFFSNAE